MNIFLTFSEKVITLLLENNVVIDTAIENNIAALESHFAEVEFELKFEITERCNLNCSFCHQEFGRRSPCHTAFSIEAFQHIIDRAKREPQIKYIRITGGEPLLHPKVGEFLRIAKEAEMQTILNTNAIALTEQRLDQLAQYVNIWKISLPSFSEERTNHITSSSLAWDHKLQGNRPMSYI